MQSGVLPTLFAHSVGDGTSFLIGLLRGHGKQLTRSLHPSIVRDIPEGRTSDKEKSEWWQLT